MATVKVLKGAFTKGNKYLMTWKSSEVYIGVFDSDVTLKEVILLKVLKRISCGKYEYTIDKIIPGDRISSVEIAL